MEMILIGEADIEVDSEEFCDANDDQANYDGNRWIIICLSTVLLFVSAVYFQYYLFVCKRLSLLKPGIEPGGWMRCSISSMSSMSITLDIFPMLINIAV